MDFLTFMKKVDAIIERTVGLTSEDMDDFDYWNQWDSGSSPKETANEALENAGWEG